MTTNRVFIYSVLTVLYLFILISCSGSSLSISSLSPSNRLINSTRFILSVNGSNFTADTVVVFNNTDLQTTFLSESELSAVVEPANTRVTTSNLQSPLGAAQDKSVQVYVRNSEGESNKIDFMLYSNWTFTEAREVNSGQTDSGDHHVITDDLDGVLYSAWQKLDPSSNSSKILFSKSSDAGQSWSTPLDVSKESYLQQIGQLSIPNLCIDDQDVLRIVWMGGSILEGSAFTYISYSSNKGESFTDPVRISSNSAGYKATAELMPTVYVEPETSTIHAAWIAFFSGQAGSSAVYAKATPGGMDLEKVSGSGFSLPKIISSGLATQPLCFRIVADKTGRVHVVWMGTDKTDGRYKLFIASSMDNGDTWGQAKILTDQFVVGGTSSGFSMALDISGNLYVVYTGALSQATPWNIYFTKSVDNGASFSAPRDLTNSLNYMHTPYIMCDTVGNLSITYQALATAKGAFYCIRSFDGGNTFTDPYAVGETATPGISLPSPFNAPSYTRTCRIIPAWNAFKGFEAGHILYGMFFSTSKWSR
jgi:hypothetical protein